MTRIPAKYVGGPCDGDRFTYDPAVQATFWRTCGGVTYSPSPVPAVPVEFWTAAAVESFERGRSAYHERQLPAAWSRLMHTLGRTGPRTLNSVAHSRARIRRRRR